MSLSKTTHTESKAQALRDALSQTQALATTTQATLAQKQDAVTSAKATADVAAEALLKAQGAIDVEEKKLKKLREALTKAQSSRAAGKETRVAEAEKALKESVEIVEGLKLTLPGLKEDAQKAGDSVAAAQAEVTSTQAVAGTIDKQIAEQVHALEVLQRDVPAQTSDDLAVLVKEKLESISAGLAKKMSQMLEDGGVELSTRVVEVEKLHAKGLSAEKVKFFNTQRSMSRNERGQPVFGKEDFLQHAGLTWGAHSSSYLSACVRTKRTRLRE